MHFLRRGNTLNMIFDKKIILRSGVCGGGGITKIDIREKPRGFDEKSKYCTLQWNL